MGQSRMVSTAMVVFGAQWLLSPTYCPESGQVPRMSAATIKIRSGADAQRTELVLGGSGWQ